MNADRSSEHVALKAPLIGFAAGSLLAAIVMSGVFYLVDFTRDPKDAFVLSAYAVAHFGIAAAAISSVLALVLSVIFRARGSEVVLAALTRWFFGGALIVGVSIYYVVARRPTLLPALGTLLPIVLLAVVGFLYGLRPLGRSQEGGPGRVPSFAVCLGIVLACIVGPGSWAQLRPGLVSTSEPMEAAIGRNVSVPTKRVLLLGWDAATWDLLEPLLAEGRLPTLARMIREGVRATVEAEPQALQPFADSASAGTRTPALFETIATGKPPLQHGIWDFQSKVIHGVTQALPFRIGGSWLGPTIPTTSDMARAERIWQMADRGGLTTLTVGWWNTWPARRPLDRGALVSDRSRDDIPDTMTPAGIVDVSKVCENARAEAGRAVITLLPALDPQKQKLDVLKEDLGQTFRADYEDDLCYFWIARELAPKMNADLITLYVSLIDIVQHKFWRYFEPERFDDVEADDARALGHAIAASYEFADYLLAQMLATFGEDTTLVLVSDHGAGAWAFDGLSGALQGLLKTMHPEYSGNHRLNGMLVMHGPGIKPGVELGTVRHEDVVPTVLALLGLASAEDLPGRTLAEGLDDSIVGARRSVVPTYQTTATEGSLRPTASASDAVVENKLRALGYIE